MASSRVLYASVLTCIVLAGATAFAAGASADSPAELKATFDRDRERHDAEAKRLIDRLVTVTAALSQENEESRQEIAALTAQLQGNRQELDRRKAEFKAALARAEAALERERAAAEKARRAIIRPTKVVGGTGGDHRFESAVAPVKVFTVWDGRYVNAITVNDAERKESVAGGRRAARATRVVLNPGETIVSIRVKYGRWIDSLTVRSSQGRTWKFGGDGGTKEEVLTVPDGDDVVSISGLAGELLDSISIQSRLK